MNIRFRDLPIVVRLSTLVTVFLAWIALEEFVIDRHQLDRFLPFYRVGDLCLYDLSVLAMLVVIWCGLHRPSRPS